MTQSFTLAVTGATGFVGRALVASSREKGLDVRPIARTLLWDAAGLRAALHGVDAVVHLAGLAHRMGREAPSPAEFDRINRQLPLELYQAASAAGVRRFVHVSTIHVVSGNPGVLRAEAPLAPVGPYAVAKAGAETGLLELARANGPELVIVRPPLVHGPGVKGNLARLLRLCDTPLPLPFGLAIARRSMVANANLADALVFLASRETPFAAPALFHATEGSDFSLRETVVSFRTEMGRQPRLVPVPVTVLRVGLSAVGRSQMAGQLLDEQLVDGSSLYALGWTPPRNPAEEVGAMVADYLARRGRS